MQLVPRLATAALAAFAAAAVVGATIVPDPPPDRAPAVAGMTAAVPAAVVGAGDPPGPAGTGAPARVAGTGEAAPRGRFGWPLAPRPAILRRFDRPEHPWSSGHRGVDLAAAVGQPVLSAGDGVVGYSGLLAGRGVVTVTHSGGLRTTYEPIDERLPVGTIVRRGSSLGTVAATTGHCAPVTCLHWGAVSGDTYRDPLSLLGFGHPILLPLR